MKEAVIELLFDLVKIVFAVFLVKFLVIKERLSIEEAKIIGGAVVMAIAIGIFKWKKE